MPDERPTRAEEAARRAELAAAHARGESVHAQRLIDVFVTRAVDRGLQTEPLRARLLDGALVKTDRRGWYLKNDRTVAIGEDGSYYVLLVPGGWLERIRGVRLSPSPPPLVVARGGRDGESGDLAFFLERRLEGRP